MTTIGENIRRIRLEEGLTQKALGELCDMNEANIRKYELGKANPKMETVSRFANALGVTPFELIGYESFDNPTEDEKDFAIEFGKKLCCLRKIEGLSQKQLSDNLGVSQAVISYWEKGERTPSIYAAKKIADCFSVSLDYLLEK